MKQIRIYKEKVTNVYKFVKEIGRGASGICYQACSRNDANEIKCIKKVQKKEGFPSEAVLLNQLSHPHIIRLFEIYEDMSNFYLVTELCSGRQLFDYFGKKGCLSENEAKQIFMQIVSTIKYCHEKKISHRDLKPENFLLVHTPQQQSSLDLKLIDFDLSFQWESTMAQEVAQKEGKRLIGTPYYIAPEVIQGNYDHRCDIWSAGVILYMLLSGVPPFNGKNPQEILKAVSIQKYSLEIPQMNDLSLFVKDLLSRILTGADKRISIDQIFKHPWMKIPQKNMKMKIDFSSMLRFSKFSKLRELVALYIASNQGSKQTGQLRRIFKTLDTNKDGYLSVEELKIALQSNQSNHKEIQNLLNFVETNKEGRVNYNQFIASFVEQQAIQSKNNLKKVFNMIDKDGNGSVDNNQLLESLMKQGYERTPLQQMNEKDEVNRIFKNADKNNDGKIDFQQFVETVCKQINN